MNRLSNRITGLSSLTCLLGGLVLCPTTNALAQNPPPPDHPAVAVRGQTYTPRSILARNMGSETDRVTQFTPHKIIGNIYYVGTTTLSSFLITTPQGHILIDSTYEYKQAVDDEVYRKWSNATLGQTDVRDPGTGQEYKVESGHNFYWRQIGTDSV